MQSSDTGEATVQTTVTIDVGQTTSAPFAINAIDDSDIDLDQTVTISANAAGHVGSTATIEVADNETKPDDINIQHRHRSQEVTTDPITTIGNALLQTLSSL